MTKYIFVTGGVVSGLGKGVCAAALGRLLKARGYRIAHQKFDPYINIDPGKLSPLYHGESFVTDDGALEGVNVGHYERFADENLTVNSNVTTGRIYWNVINKERRGEYGGKAVQVIPHITSEIKNLIYELGNSGSADIVITDIGGTVGDIESQPFLEAIRQIAAESGPENALFLHVTLVPFISGSSELKTKPTQHSVKELLSIGIQPNILVCRCGLELEESMRAKIGLFCNIESQDVIQYLPAQSVYEVPLMLETAGLGNAVCRHLELSNTVPDLTDWSAMVENSKNFEKEIKIGIVGKYTAYHDAYLSVAEAIAHAGIPNRAKCNIEWICSDTVSDAALSGLDGVVSVGYTGESGLGGYEIAAKYCREHDIPFLGIGGGTLGAVTEFAANAAGIENAGSTEFESDCAPVVTCLANAVTGEGPVYRQGLAPCKIADNTRLMEIYRDGLIYERHNCCYEVNSAYRDGLEKAGLVFSAMSPDNHLTEAVELPDKKFFVGVQYSPQFVSRPNRPHPVFTAFIAAAKN